MDRRAGDAAQSPDARAEATMQRRQFMHFGGLALAGLALPPFGRAIAAEDLVSRLDRSLKKSLADTALGAARTRSVTT